MRQTDAVLSPSHNGDTVVAQRDGNQMQSFSLAAMQRRCVGESYSMSAYNQARNSLPQLTDPAPLGFGVAWRGAWGSVACNESIETRSQDSQHRVRL